MCCRGECGVQRRVCRLLCFSDASLRSSTTFAATALPHHAQAVLGWLWLQELDNAIVDMNYLKAAKLAFKLKQPGRLLSIVTRILTTSATNTTERASSHATLARLVATFSEEEQAVAFEYMRDWNTSARHCHTAQALLHAMLCHCSPQVRAQSIYVVRASGYLVHMWDAVYRLPKLVRVCNECPEVFPLHMLAVHFSTLLHASSNIHMRLSAALPLTTQHCLCRHSQPFQAWKI
jgi:hypothetical protein